MIKKSPQALWVVFGLAGVLIVFYPTIGSGFAAMQTDPGDTRLNHYFLEHSFQLLTNRNYVGDIFSPAFFYPYRNVLAFSDNLFGAAPIYWGFRALLPPDLSFQLWTITVCLLCFVSFAIVMRRWGASIVSSLLGGFLFAFSMPRVSQLNHQQMLLQFFTPVALLFFWEFLRHPKHKTLALSLLFIYLQVLASIYLGWFLIFSFGILVAIACLTDSAIRSQLSKYLRHSAVAGALIVGAWGLLMFALLSPYLQAKALVGGRVYAGADVHPSLQVDTMLPRVSSWFLPLPDSLWWSTLAGIYNRLPMPHEHHLFMGFTVIFLTGLALYALRFAKLSGERRRLMKVCFLVALAFFLVSLRLPNGWSLWRIIYEVVPGASAIRSVTRIWTVIYLYLLVAVMLGLDSFAGRFGRRSRTALFTFICIACVGEQIVMNLPHFEKRPYQQEVAQIQSLMQNCNVAYVVWNPETPFWSAQLSAMWAGIGANVPVVNGYSGNNPPNYPHVGDRAMNIAEVTSWLGEAQGQLCLISAQPLEELHDSLQDTAGAWSSYHLQLPLPSS